MNLLLSGMLFGLLLLLTTYTNGQSEITLWTISKGGTVHSNRGAIDIGTRLNDLETITVSDSSYIGIGSDEGRFLELFTGKYPVDSIRVLLTRKKANPADSVVQYLIYRAWRKAIRWSNVGAKMAAPPPPVKIMLPDMSHCRKEKPLLVQWKLRDMQPEYIDTSAYHFLLGNIYDEFSLDTLIQTQQLLIDLTNPAYDTLGDLISIYVSTLNSNRSWAVLQILNATEAQAATEALNYFDQFQPLSRDLLKAYYLEMSELYSEGNQHWEQIRREYPYEGIKRLHEEYVESIKSKYDW